ncbi:hypothetical protein FRC17_003913 [Serendipita sp. 399]|nr:hypothetical protein FRC17_003913 [Serendipita sp. 399]
MPYSKHRVILALTKERPFDATDLKFQGFTTRVPDNPWDNVPFNSSIPYSNSTLTNGTSSTVTLSAKMIQIIVWTSIGVVSLLLITCCCWCASLRGNKESRQQQTVGVIGARFQYSHITVSVEDRTNNTNTRPEFEPSPPPYQGREINHGGSNRNATPSEDIDLATLKPVSTQEPPSVPSTPNQPPLEHNSSHRSQRISDNASNDAATALRTMYMRTLNGTDTAASNHPVYNPTFQPPSTDENRHANSASGWGYVPASRQPHRQHSGHEALD